MICRTVKNNHTQINILYLDQSSYKNKLYFDLGQFLAKVISHPYTPAKRSPEIRENIHRTPPTVTYWGYYHQSDSYFPHTPTSYKQQS
jgi:hypothetical protein